MKRTILFLTTFILIASFCKSQTSSIAITGNYIGQSVTDRMVMTIEVKENHKYDTINIEVKNSDKMSDVEQHHFVRDYFKRFEFKNT